MLEILHSLENTAVGLDPLVLVLPGIITVALGLTVWLGGLGFCKHLLVLVGAIVGAVLGFLIARQALVFTALGACAGIGLALVFRRFFVVALAAALAASAVLPILPGAQLTQSTATTSIQGSAPDDGFTLDQSVKVLRTYVSDMTAVVRRTAADLSAKQWALVAAAALVAGLCGFFLPRLASAVSCATLGASLIFAGMVTLLLFKGSEPITRIQGNRQFYALVFLGMIAFGAAEQWFLLRHAADKLKKGKQKKEPDAQPSPNRARHNWRTT